MARSTFISYKYSEAQGLRDDILEALGEDANYYKGETSNSPDLSDSKTEAIREKLKTMIHNTSVTILVVSPNMKSSKWIDWEIEYSLKEITREDRTSGTNGILGVIMKVDGGYGWLTGENSHNCGCKPRTVRDEVLYDIITKNRFNRKKPQYSCQSCKCVDKLSGSYISLIEEDDFMKDPAKYIENAFEKSEEPELFELVKKR